MFKYGFKLEPQLVKYKSKLKCMYRGLQIIPHIKNWLFVTPENLSPKITHFSLYKLSGQHKVLSVLERPVCLVG